MVNHYCNQAAPRRRSECDEMLNLRHELHRTATSPRPELVSLTSMEYYFDTTPQKVIP